MSTTDAARGIESSIRDLAERRGTAVYLVGGTVRDRLRRRRPRDLDVAVEGDAIAFARAWGRERGLEIDAAPAFGTAAARAAGGSRDARVDFSSTRGERYRGPGKLPEVFPAGIAEDLRRRDFAINAMAVPLTGASREKLLDPYGGREDLRRKVVRMLHPLSPHDDPTRAFRAVRFALRLGFRIGTETRRWIAEAISAGVFSAVSGDRVRRELVLLFSEQAPAVAVPALARLGLDRAIDPALAAGAPVRRRLRRLPDGGRRAPEDVRFAAALVAWGLDLLPETALRVADRLGLAGELRNAFLRAPEDLAAVRARLRSSSGDSPLAALARGLPEPEAIALETGLSAREAARFRRAREKASRIRLSIRGEDLRRSGMAAGPAIGRALDRTWRARVDGRIRRSDELAFALREEER
jgi:tRNA nucleotidyltransferase (CCA-adding enzyme)